MPADLPIVTEEGDWIVTAAAVQRVIDSEPRFKEMRDALLPYLKPESRSEGDVEQMRDFHAAAALARLLPLIQKQVEERMRERLEGEDAIEAVARSMQFLYETAGEEPERQWDELPEPEQEEWRGDARGVLKAALDSLDQDHEQ